MKAELERLMAENRQLRRELAQLHEQEQQARQNAESAWKLLRNLRGSRC